MKTIKVKVRKRLIPAVEIRCSIEDYRLGKDFGIRGEMKKAALDGLNTHELAQVKIDEFEENGDRVCRRAEMVVYDTEIGRATNKRKSS